MAGRGKDSTAVVLPDAAGSVFLAGQTSSPDFPVTPGVVQERLAGAQNLFVAKLDSGGRILLATYLGRTGTGTAHPPHADGAGNDYLAGAPTPSDFSPTPPLLPPSAL